jgi:hypothetical protein
MGNITIKSIDQIVKKWANRAGAAGADYTTGIQNPRRPQAQTAAAAAQTWATGVQQAVTAGTFAKNVLAAAQKYITNALGKGAQRYPSGISAGTADFQTGIAPVISVLSSITLPPRLPKGDPANVTNRVAPICAALRAMKLASAGK